MYSLCKVKVPRNRHDDPEGGRCIALLLPDLPDLGARRGWVVSSTPRPPNPQERPGTLLYSRLGGPQGRSGHVRKILPSP
jgi:hypothetical protein